MKHKDKILWSGAVFCIAASVWGSTDAVHIRNGETHTVLIKNEDGASYTGVTRFRVTRGNRGRSISYVHKDKTAQWQVAADTKGIPSRITYHATAGKVRFDFDGTGAVTASGTWNQQPLHEKNRFSPNVTAENMLVLRSLPLIDDTTYEFDLLQMDALPRLKAYPMSFKREGRTTVTVPAGTFRCLKVRFTFSDWRRFFWKAFYYITDDEQRMVVKIENIPDGGSTALVNSEYATSE